MSKVIVSAVRVMMPAMCVCCGGHPDSSLSDAAYHQGRGRDKSITFPACSMCLRHSAQERSLLGAMFSAKAARSTTCEGNGALVDYIAWKGTEHTIRFDSPRYARAFADANRAAGKAVLLLDLTAPGRPRTGRTAAVLLVAVVGFSVACCVGSILRDAPPSPTTSIPERVRIVGGPPTPTTLPAAHTHDAGHHRHHRSLR